MNPVPAPPERLFTREFLGLNILTFLVFCNLAVFFQFYSYLRTLPIGAGWYGFLIALFSVTALILRPLISPLLHPGNARRWVHASAALVIVSLLGYNAAGTFWPLFIVRAIHGASYVVLATALTALLVAAIPPGRSGQAFGLVTVITLLPFAVIPPLLEPAMAAFGGFLPVLNSAALLMFLVFPLARQPKGGTAQTPGPAPRRVTGTELLANLKDRRVSTLLLVMLLLYSSYAPVFFFIEGFARERGVPNPGLFFTLSTLSEIGVRLVAGKFFDRAGKALLAGLSLAATGIGYLALAHVSGTALFYGLGIFLGLAWGVVMPVLNALMFDLSSPRLRGLNTNLGFQMFQGGFFLGPLVGGFFLARWGSGVLFLFCALSVFLSAALTPLLSAKREDRDSCLVTRGS
jgi:MFS family permease